MKQRLILLGVAALAALAHVEALGYWFVATDTITLTASSRVSTVAGVAELFTQPLMAGTRFTKVALFYRPVASLSHALDYALWGVDPTGYHLTNLVIHGVAVALSALVVAAVTDSETGTLAGLLVALHPLTAEVVPSTARRHSLLMSVFLLSALLFLVRGRRRDSRWLLAGSVGAYALAVLTKELSLLFPGLVFAWVVLDEFAGVGTTSSRDVARAVRTALRSFAPFVLVSVVYVGVRVAVLGGLGGYHRSPPLSLGIAVDVVVKYVLSLTYTRDLVTAAFGGVGRGPSLAVGAVLGLLAVALVSLAVRHPRQRAGAIALAVVSGGLGSLPFVAVLADRAGLGTVLLGYPTPYSALVGAAFVATLVGGALFALRALPSQRTLVDGGVGQPLAFFAVWLAAPVALFLISADYTMRNGYLFLTPAMGIVAVVFVTGARNVDFDARELDASAALTVIATVFVLSLAVTSPLVHNYDEWNTAGETNRLTLTTLEGELAEAPDDTTVRISGIPHNVSAASGTFPRAQSPGYVREGTVESWIQLRTSNEVTVRIDSYTQLPRRPIGASVTTERQNGTIAVELHYSYD
ncbi:glycosyltransferase family 39 protein [Haloprofundus salilacus]|uniref:glycosyltransferase family 39 protein n=1 Tax=Haloprofundus salilacus TaxID=2876190 RepID=UPI001CCAF7A8|nr:glycosyltransferase family 39 protein [Haloprofundus salilacus]